MDSAPRRLTLKKSIALTPQQLAAAQKKTASPQSAEQNPILSSSLPICLGEIR
jgi:hypothetical protein